MTRRRVVAMCFAATVANAATFGAAYCAPPPRTTPKNVAAEAPTATVPFVLDHNRMIVEVEFLRADGSPRRARAWIDTGNPDFILAEPLARDLGLAIPQEFEGGAAHSVASTSPAPPLRLGSLALDVEGVVARVHAGPRVRPGTAAEANLPATALRHDRVVFDYPKSRMTVARSRAVTPNGVAIPCRVNPTTGLFQVTATVDGEPVELGIDNGSAGTWVSEALVQTWRGRHPILPVAIGVVGSANFFGFDLEAAGILMRLPELRLGSFRVSDIALLGLPQGLFDWYSKKSAKTVAGFLGANVLRRFRIEIDYPNRMTYWEECGPVGCEDLDIVGLTLRPEPDGSFAIAGVATRGGVPSVIGVEPGDRLVRVDGLEVAGQLMGKVIDSLRGAPGAARALIVERNGERIAVEAKVVQFS